MSKQFDLLLADAKEITAQYEIIEGSEFKLTKADCKCCKAWGLECSSEEGEYWKVKLHLTSKGKLYELWRSPSPWMIDKLEHNEPIDPAKLVFYQIRNVSNGSIHDRVDLAD